MEIKGRYPDAILFFRLGDFYETFDADAELVSRELEIVLTSKPMGKGLRVPLAGVPVQSIDQHLARLVGRGHRVAICEQLEDARASKGLVARGVVRVVSPGTALEPALLEGGAANYCAAVARLAGSGEHCAGLAAADLSTGAFRVCELRAPAAAALEALLAEELARLGAAEIVLPQAPAAGVEEVAPDWAGGALLTRRPRARFEPGRAAALLASHFGLADVEGLGLAGRPAAATAAGALLDYLLEGQQAGAGSGSDTPQLAQLAHLERPQPYDLGAQMRLDPASRRALGLFPEPGRDGRAGASLLALLDGCRTAAGKRLLRERLERPLLRLEAIDERLDRVAALAAAPLLRRRLGPLLAAIPDLERLLARVSAGLATPPELARLGRGLEAGTGLAEVLAETQAETLSATGGPVTAGAATHGAALAAMRTELVDCGALAGEIARTLVGEPGTAFEDGSVIRPGCDAEADRLRAQLRAGRAALAALETRERARTGISHLKVGYHRTFGYYLEVSASQAGRAPAEWERRQTLAGGERFVSAELRTHERTVLAARDGLAARERALYEDLCARVVAAAAAAAVRALAAGVARLDLAWALAQVAAAQGWTRPRLDRSDALEIREGRHPLVEASLPAGAFVPNDCVLRADADQALLITGPNMAGKSTYLRQTTLIVLLAQMGSFVPAAEARIGLVDRVFARVGAQDDLAAGQSTFMVEMLETANLLAACSDRSLVILDEIGRGTSTYDGLAIAQALLEHLVRDPVRGPRTLFATHFQELTALAGAQRRIVNASVAVADGADGADGAEGGGEGLRFLYRIVPGGTDRSYGIQVAAMAGLPASLLARAREILALLEGGPAREAAAREAATWHAEGSGRRAQGAEPPALLGELAALDPDGLTPLEALSALYALRERARRALGEEKA